MEGIEGKGSSFRDSVGRCRCPDRVGRFKSREVAGAGETDRLQNGISPFFLKSHRQAADVRRLAEYGDGASVNTETAVGRRV